MTVARKPIAGESTKETVNTIACGNAGRFRCDCCEYSCASTTTMRTRGCGCIGHPAFPAPSLWVASRPLGRKVLQQLGRIARREEDACLKRKAAYAGGRFLPARRHL